MSAATEEEEGDFWHKRLVNWFVKHLSAETEEEEGDCWHKRLVKWFVKHLNAETEEEDGDCWHCMSFSCRDHVCTVQADFRVYDEHPAPDAAELRKRSKRFALHEHVPVFSTDTACEYLSL